MKKILSGFLSIPIFFFLFPSPVSAQVVINEFSSATSNDDWVELYNSSDQLVDLSTYTLIDGSSSGNTRTFSCFLAPRGFIVASWNNDLNNGGDIIKLKNASSVVDCVSYGDGTGQVCEGKTLVDISTISPGEFAARSVDGTGPWSKVTSNTKDGPSDGSAKSSSAICSTPTASPTATSTQTSTATATSTSSPTKTLTPTTSPKPTAQTATPKPSSTTDLERSLLTRSESSAENLVLGLRNQLETSEPATSADIPKKDFPILPMILIFGGIVVMAVPGFVFFKKLKNDYTRKSDENREDI